jgi:hypothetical protein
MELPYASPKKEGWMSLWVKGSMGILVTLVAGSALIAITTVADFFERD